MPTITALFRSESELNQVLARLHSRQFQDCHVRVVPMHGNDPPPSPGLLGWLQRGGVLGDTLVRSDGISVLDGAVAGATIGGLGGIIAGATFTAGPVALGALGILGGGLAGYLADLAIPERSSPEHAALAESLPFGAGALLLQVDCPTPAAADAVELILREGAVGAVGRTN